MSWTLKTIVEQLEKCDFQCEAGPLKNNTAFMFLKDMTKVCPNLFPGQGVWKKVSATIDGKTLEGFNHYYIVECHRESDTERAFWVYSLSNDPCQPYHYGTINLRDVPEQDILLENPEQETNP